MNAWLGPVSLNVADRRSALRGFGQPVQGIYRPSTIPRPKLGLTETFPQVAITQEIPGTLTGFSPENAKDGVAIGVGGIGLAVLSRFLPGLAEPVSLAGGVGLIGFGLYKIYEGITGRGTPSVQSFKTPADQQVGDIAFITGKILEPSDKGQADVGAAWQAVFEGKRTFKIKFMVTNTNQKPMTVLIEFRSEQTSRPLVGDPEISNFSTSYVLELAPGETKVIPGYQPLKVLESLVQIQSYRSQDITATLLARTSSSDTGKKLDQVTFTAL